MGIPSDDVWDFWVNHMKPFNPQITTNTRLLFLCQCAKGVKEGVKAASIVGMAATIPTMAAVRFAPWVKANLNYTGRALIESGGTNFLCVSIVDKTILERVRSNAQYDKTTKKVALFNRVDSSLSDLLVNFINNMKSHESRSARSQSLS